ncbi:CCN family member 3-like [Betta splendens]|uniref:CCN family member 3 n=1 Tax=Betta splendens TaxID=158456 RepID=A0A6P7KNT1_BETSP|nr:CCN family member 3-like [Betta splendens]
MSPLFTFVLASQVFALAWSQVCPRRCQCPKEPPMCPPGVPLILDDCVCCLVCARQEGQLCSDLNPCDARRGLQCDYSVDAHGRTGVCAARRGGACVLDGSVYRSGQTFFPSCKYQCACRDGQVACVPRCHVDVMLPGPDCPAPRRVQAPGECCERWVCEAPAEASALGGVAMAAYRQEETVRFGGWDPSLNCIEQTTEWGACSQTCGVGVSTRVTNKNRQCELVKQSRLCVIRPCDERRDRTQPAPLAPKRGGRCQRTLRSEAAVHLSYRNCSSAQAYRPRYCGACVDGRCCTPHRTKTALVDFQCADGRSSRRPVMVIVSCVCHSHCPRDGGAWEPPEPGHGSVRL